MGAVLVTKSFPESADVRAEYGLWWDRERNMNGIDPYNGSISNCEKMLHVVDKVFDTSREANDYLYRNCHKWGEALAVKYRTKVLNWLKRPTCGGKPVEIPTLEAAFLNLPPEIVLGDKHHYPLTTGNETFTGNINGFGKCKWITYPEVPAEAAEALKALWDAQYDFNTPAERNAARAAFVALDHKVARENGLWKWEVVEGVQWLVGGLAGE